MSKKVYELFLFDIFVAICKIEIVVSNFNSAQNLLHDFVSWDSVIREFEIIGEATNICIKANLVDEKYRIIVDFRNKITHHYFGIDDDAVWNIIQNNLIEYKAYIITQITNIRDIELKTKLLKSTTKDNKIYPKVIEKLKILCQHYLCI